MIEEGEGKEMRLAPQERVAELAARGQGPAPGNFCNWIKETFGNKYLITMGNAIRPDPQQRSALGKPK